MPKLACDCNCMCQAVQLKLIQNIQVEAEISNCVQKELQSQHQRRSAEKIFEKCHVEVKVEQGKFKRIIGDKANVELAVSELLSSLDLLVPSRNDTVDEAVTKLHEVTKSSDETTDVNVSLNASSSSMDSGTLEHRAQVKNGERSRCVETPANSSDPLTDKKDDERYGEGQSVKTQASNDTNMKKAEIDIEDYIWIYIQYKHSGIVIDFGDRHQCGIHFQCNAGKSQLVVSACSDSKLEAACEELGQIYRLMDRDIVDFQTNVRGTCDPRPIQDLLRDTDVVLMNGSHDSYYRIVGPKDSVEEVKKKLKHLHVDVDLFSFCMPSGLNVHIRQGNIIHQRVEAIVNAANTKLQHGSGVARCIEDAAGKKFTEECRKYIKKNGQLKTSFPMHTSAGKIPSPIKYVIHVAGPMDRDYTDKELLYDALRRTFGNVLKYANDTLSVSSVAIPAISSGVFGIEKRTVAQCSYEALSFFEERQLLSPHLKQSLKDIHFVNIDEETTKIIEKVFRSMANEKSSADNGCEQTKVNFPSEDNGTSLNEVHVAVGRSGDVTPVTCVQSDHKPTGCVAQGDGESGGLHAAKGPSPHKEGINSKDASPESQGVPQRMKERKLKKDDCVICMDQKNDEKKLQCGHSFCKVCIDQYFKMGQPKCPSCGKLFGVLKGNQPPGKFSWSISWLSLEGYRDCKTIEIAYNIPNGIQTIRSPSYFCSALGYTTESMQLKQEHPNPGTPYTGAHRTCYLPDNDEGREVLQLLKEAFDAHLIFTVGRSTTSGKDNMVVWNDIHHKTQPNGPHGYPDNTYLKRVKEELAAKGIVPKTKK